MVTNTLGFFFFFLSNSSFFCLQIDIVYVFVISWHKNAKSTVYWIVIYELSVFFFKFGHKKSSFGPLFRKQSP